MMRGFLSFFLFLAFVSLCAGQSGFKESQQSYPRVREAYELFQSSHQLPEITFLSDGRHTIR